MPDSQSFSENPFRQLVAANFPARRSAGKKDIRHPKPTQTQSIAEDEDAALFMAAMERVAPAGKPKTSGFRLSDACSLDSVDSPKKRCRARKKKELEAAKDVEPAPLQAPCAEQEDQDDESAAFLQAMGDARPLKGKGREIAPPAEAATPPPGSDLSFQELLEGSLEFAVSHSDEYLEGHVVGLDPLIMGRLRSGSLSPEAHLDLHGLNAAQAFEALRDFMRGAWYKSLRVVLVVTGRGRNSPQGQAVLRQKLQLWLTQEPFKRAVLAFCTARPHDGGPGSVYVLVRKFRKKGRIFWERMPMDPDLV